MTVTHLNTGTCREVADHDLSAIEKLISILGKPKTSISMPQWVSGLCNVCICETKVALSFGCKIQNTTESERFILYILYKFKKRKETKKDTNWKHLTRTA